MTKAQARKDTIKLFGEDSFTESDDYGGLTRYYVGRLPTLPGKYEGFMGYSYEQALEAALEAVITERKGSGI